jgi:hypothetical protein
VRHIQPADIRGLTNWFQRCTGVRISLGSTAPKPLQ